MITPETVDCSDVLLIQGDAGTGKSTICDWIVPALGATFYDTSDMWRGMAAFGLMKGLDYSSSEDCEELAKIYGYERRNDRSFVCEVDVTDELRSEATTAVVSEYAGVKVLRESYTRAALGWMTARPAVASGRHMREVFPTAPLCLHIVRDLNESIRMRDGQSGDTNSHLIVPRRNKDSLNAAVAGVTDAGATILDVTGMSKKLQAFAVLTLALDAGFEVDFAQVRRDH